jgi:hypothetical protein
MNVSDDQRRQERLTLLGGMLKDAFGEAEELQKGGGRRYGFDCQAELAVEHTSGRPRLIFCPSIELLINVDAPFERRFKEGIEKAKRYFDSKKGVYIVQLLTSGVRLYEYVLVPPDPKCSCILVP